MKITFLSGIFERATNKEVVRCNPSIAYYWLRSFFETTKPHLKNKVTWSRPLYFEEQIEDYVSYILKENPDILCSTLYIWNVDLHYLICKKVKEINPKIKIVFGGPEIDARNIGSNFDRFPLVDAVVYGDGEESFAEIIEQFIKTGKITEGINRATSKKCTGHYKRFQYKDYPPYSFFSSFGKELKEDWEGIKKKFGAKKIQLATEYMRGCSYGCTFCDWSAGLHHKVTKREKETIKQELDFLQDLLGEEVSLWWCDANWGLGKHYDELTNYVIEKGMQSTLGNWTKINKWQAFELWKKHIVSDDLMGKKYIAMQSPKQETLDAIKRPEEFTWEEQLEYIQAHDDFIKELNDSGKFKIKRMMFFEFIHDLPLMTLEDYKKIFRDMNRFVNCNLHFYNWIYLPNSPAAKPGYLEKYDLEVVEVEDLSEISTDLSKTNKKTRIIVDKTKLSERMFVKLMTYFYNYKTENSVRSKESQQIIENHMDEIYDIAEKLAKTQTKQFNGQWSDSFKIGDRIVSNEDFFNLIYTRQIRKLLKF
jgi:hypothetical protein